VYVFQKAYIFNALSTATGTILGGSANGWTSWKDKKGLHVRCCKKERMHKNSPFFDRIAQTLLEINRKKQ